MTPPPPRPIMLLTPAVLLAASCVFGQTTNDPFQAPIVSDRDVITVSVVEFATLPDAGGEPARMMHLRAEPGGTRLFVADMWGRLYTVSADGSQVTLYLDLDSASWGLQVEANNFEQGFQSVALHPQFNQPGTPGHGKLYTLLDTRDTSPPPDFAPPGSAGASHHTILLEWTARDPAAPAYDGDRPRELMRFEQPFRNHNGGDLRFDPLAAPGDDEFGLLHVGAADGGSGGDPFEVSQDVRSAFGTILRIDPLGSNGANGRYGIPASNPFATSTDALGEIFAYGVRNPQRFAWDTDTGVMYVADIGQDSVEEISPVPAGGNLGWNDWEGGFQRAGGGVDLADARGEPDVTFPVAEYDHVDPLLQRGIAVTMCCVYRHAALPALDGLLLFGDNPSGELFYVGVAAADGGQRAIRRVLFDDDGTRRTLLDLVRAKTVQQGRGPAGRVDLRFDATPDGRLFVLNKQDSTIRRVVAATR